MKKLVLLLSFIFSVSAQEEGDIKGRYGLRDFDDFPAIGLETLNQPVRGSVYRTTYLTNNNPQFLSASSDSGYEDSAYAFNILTNDPDGDSVTVSITSKPSWLSLSSFAGYTISDVTKHWQGELIANNVQATENLIAYPIDAAVDNNGNLYFSAGVIRKVDTSGNMTIFAGTGESGYSGDGGAATSARINDPHGLAFDSDGNLLFADRSNHCIRKIDTNGIISTIAGTGESGYSGDGGAATSAQLNTPYDVAIDASGNWYIADEANHRIRKVGSDGIISTYVGTGESGYSGDGGAATSAQITGPNQIAIDNSGNLFFAQPANNVIRKVDTALFPLVRTVAGDGTWGFGGDGGAATSAQLAGPLGVAVDASGNLYIADYANDRIRKVDTNGSISTFAGTGTGGFSGDGGAATSAQLNGPENIIVYNNSYYITDALNYRVRKIDSDGIISTIAGIEFYNGDNILASIARVHIPRNPAFDKDGNFYFTEQESPRVRKIDTNGIITTVAGNGTNGFSGDGGAATSAQFNGPRAVTVDKNGNLYIAEGGNNRIRKVDTNGIISTYAGTGAAGYSGDGGAATSAKINFPYQLVTDNDGNLYFCDANNHVIRKVDSNGIISTFAGTPESSGYSGDGGAATSAQLSNPLGVALDSDGNIYISEYNNNRIRKVNTDGNISTIAGTGESGYSGDGGAATSASLNSPAGLALDKSDNLYFCDVQNHAIRKVWKSGIITTIVDNLNLPFGLAIDSISNVYITDTWAHVIRKVDASYHTLTGTPFNSDVGSHTMIFTASDGQGGSASQSFTLKVINVNDAPEPFELVFPSDNAHVGITRQNYLDTLYFAWNKAIDIDGDAVTYDFEFNDDLGLLYWHLFDHCDNTKLMCNVPYHRIEDYLSIEGVEVVSGTWTIVATDGVSKTLASNGPLKLTIDASQVGIEETGLIPETFALHANYPNPFNPTTTISYDLPEQAQVTLGIYDILGKQIKTLVNQSPDAGNKIAVWDGTDELGRTVSAGLYIYRIKAGSYSKTMKMVLLK